jgi:hypothetical protein
MDVEGSGHGLILSITGIRLEGLKRTTKTLSHDIRHSCLDSNQEPPAYKSENLPLEETFPMLEENFKIEISERGFGDLKWIALLQNEVSGEL